MRCKEKGASRSQHPMPVDNKDELRNNTLNHNAKVRLYCDMEKVFRYFLHNVGTTLDCAMQTHILRNSITYYVAELERLDMLRWVFIKSDKNTGHKAKHYSADKSLWRESDKKASRQLLLF